MSTSEALAAGATAKARVTPTPRPGYINLRLEISDGLQPLAATVWLERMDADTLTIGPASVVTLQVPVNQSLKLTVQATGYLDWTQSLTPTQSLDLAVVMNEGP
jgi:hypothetical protein